MLRPTFYAFETAKRALSASQMGLDTVGHNISNVNTPGYTRQRVDQVTFNVGSYRAKYAAYGYTYPGQGSEVTAITQIRDPYLDKRYRTEAAKAGEQSVVSDGLDKLNLIFDEIKTTGNHAKIGEFLTQLDALIASAGSAEQATVLRAKAESLAKVLNQNSIDLENAAIQQMEEMENNVKSINLLLEQIADLNVKIKEDHFYGNPSNENNDMRNLLIDQLSELIDIDVHHIPQKVAGDLVVENIKITVKGSRDPEVVLVNSGDYNAIKAKYTSTRVPPPAGKDSSKYDYLDKVSYHLVDGMTGLEMPLDATTRSSDITGCIYTGALKGHLDILNGKGTDAKVGENTFRGIPYTQAALDDYAQRLAKTLNDLNRLDVYDTGGNVIAQIDRPLFVRNDAGTNYDPADPLGINGITARNIAISDQWAKNPQYIAAATRNNALYTDVNSNGDVCLVIRNDDGTMTTTDIDYRWVQTISSDGYLVDANGNYLCSDGRNTTDKNDPDIVNISQLQRAMTENNYKDTDPERPYYFANEDGYLVINDGANDIVTNIVYDDGMTFDGTYPYNGTDELLDADGNVIEYNGAPITFADLVRQKAAVNYSAGQPTPNHLLPGANANDNLDQMKIALTAKDIVFKNGFKGSFQEYLIGFQEDMANDKEVNDSLLSATLNVLTGLADSRDAVSAVSVDEEAINMMTFQNYYNAAARYMTVLDEALGTIIQGMGIVGR